MKQKYFIDTHKGVTFLAILAMMAYFNQWQNTTAWVYLALHGTYGILWVAKSRIFPDKQWEVDKGLGYGLLIWIALSLYWITGFLITWKSISTPGWVIAICISMYVIGTFLHFVTDMQKYVELKLNPNHLITTGLFSRARNINYFGELLIYLGFGLLAMHWLPIIVILLYLIFVWGPNMARKDKSLSRYPDFAEYQHKTKLFIPFIF